MADKEFKYDNTNHNFIKNYIQKLKNENIKVGIITNHNKFDKEEFVNLKKQAKKEEILLIPGTELSVKEGKNGIHILIAFSNDWIDSGKDNINTFLDSVFIGINNRENENTRCKEDLTGVIQKLDDFNMDYFIILAHVDNNSGIFNECDGGLIKSLFSNEKIRNRVLGIQKSTNRDNYRNFVEWINKELARVEGSDPKKIEDIGKGNKKTYLKIGNFDYKTIKYALMDYNNRIFDNIQEISHGYIESLKFNGGVLDCKELKFSSELNNIIGIRGSGKSAILEIIRNILNMDCSDVDKKYKEDIVTYYMGSGGVAELKIRDKYGKGYTITKHFSENIIYITDEFGEPKDIKIESLLNNVLYFGQKDLSIRIDGYEEDLLNKLIGKSKMDSSKLNENVTKLKDVIKKYYLLELLPEKLEDKKKEHNTIKEQLKIFDEKGVKDKLEKEEAFNEDGNKIKKLTDSMKEISNIENIENDFSFIKEYKSKYNKEFFTKIVKVIEDIEKLINKKNSIENNIKQKTTELENLYNEYKKIKGNFISEFENVKRELNLKENLDGDTYLKLKKELEEVNNDIEKMEKQLKSKEKLRGELIKLFKKRRELIIEDNNKYLNYIEGINSNQNNIKIEFVVNGNKEKFYEDLRDELKKTNITKNTFIEIADNFIDYLGILEDILLNDANNLKDISGVNIIEKIKERFIKDIDNVCQYTPNNKIIIKYHDKNIENYSLGQRASAVLLFILAQYDNDIIMIDQPEDDMDNQVIYKELIKTIKKAKENIQFIFTTHNPNIPVLGDAEEVIGLKNENGLIIDNDSIDNEVIQKDIVEIMEGGQEAFQRREKIYNEWNNI
jgi:hypothetical protein